ncbi:MAG: hypothetical protein J6K16_04285 [Alphaproteobacteria bacterium]|nr:hypothetical protein [Alphaproteobacteria bacterium]
MYSFSYWKNYLERKGVSFSEEPFIPFMILWMSYNSFYNKLDNRCGDRRKACKIGEDEKAIEIFERRKNNFLNDFKNIAQNSDVRLCVINMQNRNRNVYFDNNHCDIKDFLSAVYQVRCNLFHGDKTPYWDADVRLVSWAYNSLYALLHEYKPDLF